MNLQVSQRWSAGVVRTNIDHAPTSHPCISKYIHLHILCRCKDYLSTSIVYMHPSIHLPAAQPEDFLRCCNQSMCVGLGTSAGSGTSVGCRGENGVIVFQFFTSFRVRTFLATWKVFARCLQGVCRVQEMNVTAAHSAADWNVKSCWRCWRQIDVK